MTQQNTFLLTSLSETEFRAVIFDTVKQLVDSAGGIMVSEPEQSLILDKKGLASRLDVCGTTIDTWREKGKIPYYQVGGQIRYNYQKVLTALEVNKSKGGRG